MQHLENGDSRAALKALQQDLGTLKAFREERLHQLAGCMLCTSSQSLKDNLNWPGRQDNMNRKQLLRDLQVGSYSLNHPLFSGLNEKFSLATSVLQQPPGLRF